MPEENHFDLYGFYGADSDVRSGQFAYFLITVCIACLQKG